MGREKGWLGKYREGDICRERKKEEDSDRKKGREGEGNRERREKGNLGNYGKEG